MTMETDDIFDLITNQTLRKVNETLTLTCPEGWLQEIVTSMLFDLVNKNDDETIIRNALFSCQVFEWPNIEQEVKAILSTIHDHCSLEIDIMRIATDAFLNGTSPDEVYQQITKNY